MRMAIRFQNGLIGDAILLAAGRDRVRVVVSGRARTEEWSVVNGHWFDEGGELIEIEALMAVPGISYGDVYPMTAAASGFGRLSD